MTQGVFRCFGTIPHIKEKYGNGFNLFVKLQRPSAESMTDLFRQSNWINEIKISAPSSSEVNVELMRELSRELSNDSGGKVVRRQSSNDRKGKRSASKDRQ